MPKIILEKLLRLKGVRNMVMYASLKHYGDDTNDALSNSKIRRDVIIYLKDGQCKTIYAISRCIGASYANTKGAIVGYGKGYPASKSLVSLGMLISERKQGFSICYRLSPQGLEIANILGAWQ